MLLTLVGVLACGSSSAAARLPPRFFGVDPQEVPSPEDARWMSAGGIEVVRAPLSWSAVEPAEPTDPHSLGEPMQHDYRWSLLDRTVEVAAVNDLDVLPFLYRTPAWQGTTPTRMPTENVGQRTAWTDFVEAAVERYGPEGEFWAEHAPGSADPLPATGGA